MNNLNAALSYHRNGRKVLPLEVGGKRVIARLTGKWKDKTITEEMVWRWWTQVPDANIGLVLEGLTCVDVDNCDEIDPTILEELNSTCSCIVRSGHDKGHDGGHYYYYGETPSHEFSGGEIKSGPGDYTAIPPSKTKDTYTYTTEQPWLCLIGMPQSLQQKFVPKITEVEVRPVPVQRHPAAVAVAFKLRHQGMDGKEMLAGLHEWNDQLPIPMEQERAREEFPPIVIWVAEHYKEKIDIHTLRALFIQMNEGTLLRITDRGLWVRYYGGYWHVYDDDEFKSLVLECTDSVGRLKIHYTDALRRWSSGEKVFHKKEEEFDTSLDVLNCKSVTWSPDGEYEHRKEDLITRIVDVDYNPDILRDLDESRWGRFLEETCEGQEGLLEWLQLTAGYSLYGHNEQQVIFFVCGPRDTGKTTFLEAIRSVLGPYATTMDPRSLMKATWQRDGASHSADLVALKGKRFVVGSELSKGGHVNEALVKRLTSNEAISVRAAYGKQQMVFVPEATFWLMMNDLPTFEWTDEALQKRIKVVPFENTVDRARMDRKLLKVFQEDVQERQIILAWLADGAERYYHEVLLEEPPCVRKVTEEYFEVQCPYVAWFRSCCEEGKDFKTTSSDMVQSIEMYSQNVGMVEASRAQLSNKYYRAEWLKARGFTKGRVQDLGRQVSCWVGFRIV